MYVRHRYLQREAHKPSFHWALTNNLFLIEQIPVCIFDIILTIDLHLEFLRVSLLQGFRGLEDLPLQK